MFKSFAKIAAGSQGYNYDPAKKRFYSSEHESNSWRSPEDFAGELKKRHKKGERLSYTIGANQHDYDSKDHDVHLEKIKGAWKVQRVGLSSSRDLDEKEEIRAARLLQKQHKEHFKRQHPIIAKLHKALGPKAMPGEDRYKELTKESSMMKSFEKIADIRRVLGQKAVPLGKNLFKSRMDSIARGTGRTAERFAAKTHHDVEHGIGGSLLSGEKAKLQKGTKADIKDRSKRIFGNEGKPTTLGRMVAKHPIAAGVGTYAASKAALGGSDKKDEGPSVTYPNTSY